MTNTGSTHDPGCGTGDRLEGCGAGIPMVRVPGGDTAGTADTTASADTTATTTSAEPTEPVSHPVRTTVATATTGRNSR